MSALLRHPQTAEQRMLLGIAELLVGLPCHLFFVWPAAIGLLVGRRWDEGDEDLDGAAWSVGTFASGYEIRERGVLIRSSEDEDEESEGAAKRLIAGRALRALRVTWPELALEVEIEGGVLVSATPEHEDDPDLYYWEILTPEMPRLTARRSGPVVEARARDPRPGARPPSARR